MSQLPNQDSNPDRASSVESIGSLIARGERIVKETREELRGLDQRVMKLTHMAIALLSDVRPHGTRLLENLSENEDANHAARASQSGWVEDSTHDLLNHEDDDHNEKESEESKEQENREDAQRRDLPLNQNIQTHPQNPIIQDYAQIMKDIWNQHCNALIYVVLCLVCMDLCFWIYAYITGFKR